MRRASFRLEEEHTGSEEESKQVSTRMNNPMCFSELFDALSIFSKQMFIFTLSSQ